MPSNRVRVDVPTSASDMIKLAQAISAKHAELGDESPLGKLKWDKINDALTAADAAHAAAKRLPAQAEAATEKRDTALEVLQTFVRASRDILSGVHADEMRKLGDYGFTVNAGAAATRKPPEPSAAAN